MSDPLAPKGDAIRYDEIKPLDSDTAAPVGSSIDMNQIHSLQELQQAMKFDASINARYLFFSAGAGVDLSTSYSSVNDSFVWVLSASVDYGRFRVQRPHLTAEAQKLIDGHQLNEFRKQYGTGFIRTVRKGAFLSAIFSVDHLTLDQQRSLSNQFTGGSQTPNVGLSISSGKSDFLKSALQYGAVNFHYFGTGGPGLAHLAGIIRNVGDFENVANTLSSYVAGINVTNAPAIEFEAVPYSIIGVRGLDVIPTRSDQQLSDLMYSYFTAQGRARQLREILDNHTSTYSYLDEGRLTYFAAARDEYTKYTERAMDAASKLKSGQPLTVLPNLPEMIIGVPIPSVSAGHTFWHENAGNTADTQIYVKVFNAVVGSVKLHKPDGSVQQFNLAEALTSPPFQLQNPVTYQMVGPYKILTEENMTWMLPGHQNFTGAQIEIVSHQGTTFLTTTLGAPTSASR